MMSAPSFAKRAFRCHRHSDRFLRPSRRGVGTLLAICGLIVVGCGGGNPNSTSPSTSVSSSSESKPSSANATSTVKNDGNSESMPDDVPIYPEAKSTNFTRVGTQSVGGWKTSDAPTTVVAFYEKKLAEKGWTIDVKSTAAAGGTFKASKGSRTLTVAVARALPEGAVINLSHRP